MLGVSKIGSVMWMLTFCVGLFQGAAAAYEEVFSVSEAFQPTKSSVLTSIDIVDEMHFELDITIHSFPSGWGNIIHATPSGANCCGVGDRMPGVWLHPSSNSVGFLIVWDSNDRGNFHFWTHDEDNALVLGETYHLAIDVTQSRLTVQVDVDTVYDASKTAHPTSAEATFYASDPWYDAADVTISNLFIGVPGSPTVEPSKDPTAAPTEQPTVEPTAQPSAEPTEEPTRDCSVFHIDEFLMDCSVEFDAHDAHIDTLKSDVASMKDELSDHELDIADLKQTVSKLVNATATMTASIDSINAEMQIVIESLDRMGDYP